MIPNQIPSPGSPLADIQLMLWSHRMANRSLLKAKFVVVERAKVLVMNQWYVKK
jgi:hypothetical protein